MNQPEHDVSLVGLLAARLRLTEGQFYTVVIAIILSLLLTMTGLPGAHKTSDSGVVPPPTVTPITQPVQR